jgi:phosphoribosyl 1,2-cyclic phosphodiesterase
VLGENTTIYVGNTTCLEITLQGGRKVIIDAGSGIRLLGDKLVEEKGGVDIYLLITHIHWDHILGFPFFFPIYNPASKILIDGYHTCMKGLTTPPALFSKRQTITEIQMILMKGFQLRCKFH